MKKSKGSAALGAIAVDQDFGSSVPKAAKKTLSNRNEASSAPLLAHGKRSPGLLVCDAALRILKADVSASALFGCTTPQDLVQKDLLDFLLDIDRRRAGRTVQKLLEGHAETIEEEFRALSADGRHMWTRWRLRLMPALGRAGAAPRLCLEIVDINSPDERESDLIKREKMLCRALDRASIGMIIGTPVGRTLLINQAMCDILGYEMSEVNYVHYASVTHPDDRASVREVYRQLLAGEIDHYHGEKRYIRKDGRSVWASNETSLVRDEKTGEPIAFVVLAENIDARKKAAIAVAEIENILRTMLDSSPVGLSIIESDGRYRVANQAFCRILGCEPDELTETSTGAGVKLDESAEDLQQISYIALMALEPVSLTKTYTRKNGEDVSAQIDIKAMRDEKGVFLYGIAQVQDVSARARQIEELHEAKELAQVTIASVAEGLIRTDIEGRITLCNEAAANLIGRASSEIQGKYFSQLVSFVDHRNGRSLPDPVTAVLLHGKPVRLGPFAGLKRHDGRVRPIIDSTAPLRGLDARMIGTVVVIQDATETFVLTERLAAQAYRDDLTRLPNRRAFEDHIAERLRGRHQTKRMDFLLFVDLDHFKVVNDTCGHAIGDELLREAALILRDTVRESDFVARLGGDEFGILLHATTERVAAEVSECILNALGKYRFIRNGRSFEIGASIGMTTVEACSGDASAVMVEADTACYAAKNLGRGRFHMFRRDDETIADAQRSMGWLHRIQQGFEKSGFRLFVQKITDVAGETCGYEALLRLVEDDGTLCSPAAFLPVAKRFGLMARIDRLIFQKAFDLLSGRSVLGEQIGSRYMSVNMSAASLADPMFRAWLNEMLLRNPEVARCLWIEITETDEMHWATAEMDFLANIRGMGVRLYLDDFGTGYNSFEVLKRINVDGIKIDRSVVRDIVSDPIDQALVIAAISIVADLKIDLVAEGVEDRATLEFLAHHGIRRFQGFLFHRPEETRLAAPAFLQAEHPSHEDRVRYPA
jgi:diguanylate cyclase